MPTTEPIRAALLCRYPVASSGLTIPNVTYLYFLAEDLDMTPAHDGSNIITHCQAVELIAVA